MRVKNVRSLLVLLFVTLVSLAAAAGPAEASRAGKLSSCQDLFFDVSVSGQALPWRIAGRYCPGSGDVLQLLLSGVTYDSRYWDAPGENSYVRYAATRGVSTLAIDRPGTGVSGKPSAAELTGARQVEILHELINRARSGELGRKFAKVQTVGHSFGAAIAAKEAGRFGDVDGVILTSFVRGFGPKLDDFAASLVPADTNAGLTGRYPDGYLTTRPGARAALFEASGDTAPLLSEFDERTKSTTTPAEQRDLGMAWAPEVTQAIKVPVFLAVGQADALFCGQYVDCTDAGSVARSEGKFFAEGVLRTFVLLGAGHSMNLQNNAPSWFKAAVDWVFSS
ncbi:alpha/beta hydrolase [Amycolatopsis sp. lyj-108]|uniref:alpha/beta hydrolase n=1 Tax=Amycolatopsis sp. lyj-108 TaxID=2789286 RepID=UPI00397C5FAD